jgi:protein gp37
VSTNTAISWTDATWNPIRGCSRVSEGCRNCYAERVAGRFGIPRRPDTYAKRLPYQGLVRSTVDGPRWTGEVRFIEEALDQPLRWKKPRRIFVNSMSDLFHEKLTDEQIWRVFDVMSHAGWLRGHTFQVLTKRPERMRDFMLKVPGELAKSGGMKIPWPPPTVWLGVSVENQEAADERIPLLLETPAAVRFLSVEPLLAPVTFRWAKWEPWKDTGNNHLDGLRHLDWVIVGGESGPGYREMPVKAFTDVADQCREAKVPLFVKQDSGPRPGGQGRIPDALWLHEFPRGVGGLLLTGGTRRNDQPTARKRRYAKQLAPACPSVRREATRGSAEE